MLRRHEEEMEKPELIIEGYDSNINFYFLKIITIMYIPFLFLITVGYDLFVYLLGESAGQLMFFMSMALYIALFMGYLMYLQYSAQAEASKYYNMIVHIWINDRAYAGVIKIGGEGIREYGRFPIQHNGLERYYYAYLVIPKNRILFYDRALGDYLEIDALVIATPDKWSRTFHVQPNQAIIHKNMIVYVPAVHGDLEFRGVSRGDSNIMFLQTTQSSWFSVRRSELAGLVDVEPVKAIDLSQKYYGMELLYALMSYRQAMDMIKAKFQETQDMVKLHSMAVKDIVSTVISMERLARMGEENSWKKLFRNKWFKIGLLLLALASTILILISMGVI